MPKLGVVITSCAAYAASTLPVVLGSLAAAGVPSEVVRVVVGDCDTDRDVTMDDGVRVHRRRYAMLDNNGLAWMCFEGWRDGPEWIVYLHDTCAVDPGFWNECARVVDTLGHADCARLVPRDSMGMGLYRAAWLRGPVATRRLRVLETTDAGAREQLKQRLDLIEDTLFKVADRVVTLAQGFEVEEAGRPYGPEACARRTEHYFPGIRKFKANWGQHAHLRVTL